MTKREYLISIGYEVFTEESGDFILRTKKSGKFEQAIVLFEKENDYYCVKVNDTIETQREIDDLQIAFNNLRRDFDETQKYDD